MWVDAVDAGLRACARVLGVSVGFVLLVALLPALTSSVEEAVAGGQLQGGLTLEGRLFELGDEDTPVSEAVVELLDSDGDRIASIFFDDDGGAYSFTGLSEGDYRLVVLPGGSADAYLDIVYADPVPVICTPVCPVLDGDVVTLGADGLQLDIGVPKGGRLTGSIVEDSDSSTPLGAEVELLNEQGGGTRFSAISASEDGAFEILGIWPGTYKAFFSSPDHFDVLYKDVPCPNLSCDQIGGGDAIVVEIGSDQTLDPVRLSRSFSIEGRVFDRGDQDVPVTEFVMELFDTEGQPPTVLFFEDPEGGFRFDNLEPGDYRLRVRPEQGSAAFLAKDYTGDADLICGVTGCPDIPAGEPIQVGPENVSLDIGLPRGGVLRGNVVDGNDDSPLAASVTPIHSEGILSTFGTQSDSSSGDFEVTGLPPGSYKLFFSSSGYTDLLFPDTLCPDFDCDLIEAGDDLNVSLGSIEDIGTVEMSSGSTIEGTVDGSDGPITEANVELYNSVGNFVTNRFVDEQGHYRFDGLTPGDFRLQVNPFGANENYFRYVHEGNDCLGPCDLLDGDLIELPAEEDPLIIDITLQRGLLINVTAFDRNDPTLPVQDACIEILDADGDFVNVQCDEQAGGFFTSAPLLPGDYKVLFDPFGESVRYEQMLFDDVSCDPSCNFSEQGDVLTLVDEDVEIEFRPRAGNLLSGTVTDSDSGDPVRDIEIFAIPVGDVNAGFPLGGVFADDGAFEVRVPDGEYYLEFWPFPWGQSELYVRQVYPGVPCTPLGCDRESARVFNFSGNKVVSIAPEMELGGLIAGTVLDENNAVITSATVRLFSEQVGADDSRDEWSENVAPDGNYEFFQAIPAGRYFLGALSEQLDPELPLLIDLLFDAKPCPGLACDFESTADALNINPGQRLDIPFRLPVAETERVTGQVVDGTTGNALQDVRVDVYRKDIDFMAPLRTTLTDEFGNFELELPEGEYGLVFERGGYITRMFGSFFSEEGWCPARRCSDFPGLPIEVGSGSLELDAIPMLPGAGISGTLSLPEGGPVGTAENVEVQVYDEDGQRVFGLTTVATPGFMNVREGSFEVEVPPGRWHLLFEAGSFERSLVPTALGNNPCPGGACGMENTPAIEVVQGDQIAESANPDDPDRPVDPNLAVTFLDGVPLTGVIIDGDFDSNLAEAFVFFYDEAGNFVHEVRADEFGLFQSRIGFPDGTFYAATRQIIPDRATRSGLPSEFVDVIYGGEGQGDAIVCVGDCDVTVGKPIEVELEADALPGSISVRAERGASISGRVVDEAGEGVDASISIFDDGGIRLPGAETDEEDGSFLIEGLVPGDYFVRTRNREGLQDELWQDVACAPFCSPLGGTAIPVGSEDVTDIDFTLGGALSLSGTVGTTLEEDAELLESIEIEIYNALGLLVGSTVPNDEGAWTLDGLPAGQFFVRTRNDLGLVNVAWDGDEGKDCTGCDVTATEPIVLPRSVEEPGIVLKLDAGGAISGTVRRAGGDVIAGVTIDIFSDSGRRLLSTTSDTSGEWSVNGLSPGDYYVATRGSLGFVNQLFAVPNNQICEPSCSPTSGAPITLDLAEERDDINFELEPAARISGWVTEAGTDQVPISGVLVQAFDSQQRLLRQTTTGSDGRYELRGLPPVEVFLRTRAEGNFTDQTFDGRECIPLCDLAGSDTLDLELGDRRTDKDFALASGGVIAGSVKTSGGDPLSSLSVEIYNAVGDLVATRRTNSTGEFLVRGLPDGRYFARTRNTRGLIDKVFGGATCTPFPCVTGEGEALVLADGSLDADADVEFRLAEGEDIAGTATDQFGNPLPAGEVVLFDADGEEVKRGPVADGEWRLRGIADGTYYAVLLNGSGLIDELFNSPENTPCPGGRCVVTDGEPIVIGQGGAVETRASLQSFSIGLESTGRLRNATADLIGFQLARGLRISGTVENPDGDPLSDVRVSFFNSSGELVGSTETDGRGAFVSESGFSDEDDYFVATTDGLARGVEAGGFVNVVYAEPDMLSCPLECNVTRGTAVPLGGQPDDVTIVVQVGGALTGSVEDDQGVALAGSRVEVYDADGFLAGTVTVGSSGNWTVDGLPDGDYRILLRNDLLRPLDDLAIQDDGFASFCDGPCKLEEGSIFSVSDQGVSLVNVRLTDDRLDEIFADRFQGDGE